MHTQEQAAQRKIRRRDMQLIAEFAWWSRKAAKEGRIARHQGIALTVHSKPLGWAPGRKKGPIVPPSMPLAQQSQLRTFGQANGNPVAFPFAEQRTAPAEMSTEVTHHTNQSFNLQRRCPPCPPYRRQCALPVCALHPICRPRQHSPTCPFHLPQSSP